MDHADCSLAWGSEVLDWKLTLWAQPMRLDLWATWLLLNFSLNVPSITELLSFVVSTLCRWMDSKRSGAGGFLLRFQPHSWGLTLVRCCAHHCLQLCSFPGSCFRVVCFSSSTFLIFQILASSKFLYFTQVWFFLPASFTLILLLNHLVSAVVV